MRLLAFRRVLPFVIARRGDDAAGSLDDVIPEGAVVGRIMLFSAEPAELPWMWTITPGYEEGRTPTHGYAESREAATQAFAMSWHRG